MRYVWAAKSYIWASPWLLAFLISGVFAALILRIVMDSLWPS